MKLNIKTWSSILLIIIMFLVAGLTGEKEIIFPEAAALAIGAWIIDKQPWEVNRKKIMILMSASSIFGYMCSAFFDIPLFFKVLIGFIFCGVCLMLSRCTMLPMISACILPVLIETRSIIYPVSVIVMTVIIISVQRLLEKYKLRNPYIYYPIKYNKKEEKLRWLFLSVIFIITATVAIGFNIKFIIAPPLIVTLCEFSYIESNARKSPLMIFVIIILCAFIGAYARLLLCNILNLSLILSAAIVITIVLYGMSVVKKWFPPAGAIALLPFIIDNNLLFVYPFEVMVGSAIFITSSMFFGKYIISARVH